LGGEINKGRKVAPQRRNISEGHRREKSQTGEGRSLQKVRGGKEYRTDPMVETAGGKNQSIQKERKITTVEEGWGRGIHEFEGEKMVPGKGRRFRGKEKTTT